MTWNNQKSLLEWAGGKLHENEAVVHIKEKPASRPACFSVHLAKASENSHDFLSNYFYNLANCQSCFIRVFRGL